MYEAEHTDQGVPRRSRSFHSIHLGHDVARLRLCGVSPQREVPIGGLRKRGVPYPVIGT
jgi:hypothetical protein